MSLWKVDDLATAVLMEQFYMNMLQKRLARDASLRHAQTFVRDLTIGHLRAAGWLTATMISRLAGEDAGPSGTNVDTKAWLEALAGEPEEYRPFRHPRFWGAFICQGDPSPLALGKKNVEAA